MVLVHDYADGTVIVVVMASAVMEILAMVMGMEDHAHSDCS